MKKIAITVLATLAAQLAITQDLKVNGTATSGQKPIESAGVSLLNGKDSAVKSTVTDRAGHFELAGLKKGSYRVKVQAIGYATYMSEVFSLGNGVTNYTLKAFNMTVAARQLDAVTVSSEKPPFEQKIDRTVVNVDASPSNAGLSMLDVLEKSPGVSLDKDGNISLKGRSGVLILIDGKPSYLSGQDLTNMLKNMPSSGADQIEIMTNPPARFDASGNSGVINIKTKKNKAVGYNGSFTVGGGQGVYPNLSNSVNMNYRNGKINLFGSYGYYENKNLRQLELTRKFHDSATGNVLSIFDQHSDMINHSQSHNFKLGVDLFASKRTTIGFVFSGIINPSTNSNNNTTDIEDNTGKLQSSTVAASSMDNRFTNSSLNLNFLHNFDSAGRQITADIDYVHYKSENNQYFNNFFYNASGIKMQPDEFLRGILPSLISIYSAKIDYTLPLKGNAKFEAGVKSSLVQTDNNAQYDSLLNNNWQTDYSKTNHFLYKENINAAYINLSKQFTKKWSGQLGLRLENTISDGNQLTTNTVFDRSYTQLFPTAYLGYTPNESNQFSLSYGRRINRPDYSDMNPFYYFLDKYTYQVGNPYLQPQISSTIDINHTFKGFLTTSLSFQHVNDIILDVINQVDSTHTSYVKKDNVAMSNSITLSESAFVPVTKFWKVNVYLQGNYNNFSGTVNGGYLSVDGLNFMTNISNQFQFNKVWVLELSGFYRSKAIQGTLVGNSMEQLNFAVNKKVLKGKGTLRVNFRDFLNLQHFSGYSRYQNVDLAINNVLNNRTVNVGFTYRFSKGKAPAAPQRKKGGADDEESRVKSGGGN